MRRRCCCKSCRVLFEYEQLDCEDPEDDDYNCCTLYFFDQSPDAVAWYWEFSDGVTSTEQNPVHHFFNSDTVPWVRLTITKANSVQCTIETEIPVGCSHVWCSRCKNIGDPFEANGTGKYLPYYLNLTLESAIGCYPTEGTDCCSDNFHTMIGGGWVLVRSFDGDCVWCSDEFGHCVISAIDPDVYFTGQWCARLGFNTCPTSVSPSGAAIEVYFVQRIRNVSDDSLVSTTEATASNIYFEVQSGVYSAGKFDCENLILSGSVWYAATCDFSGPGNRAFVAPGCAINPGPGCSIPDDMTPWAYNASLAI